MVKRLKTLGLTALLSALLPLCAAAQPLEEKIASIEAFSAEFTQVVKDSEGKTVSESAGTLALKKPQSFMLHTEGMDELYLYTRADGVYYFDPFVNQLTILPLSALERTPFALLVTKDPKVWQNYEITEVSEGKLYQIRPVESLAASADFVKLELTFSGNYLSSLAIYFKDGSCSTYELKAQRFETAADAFDFQLPPDVETADER